MFCYCYYYSPGFLGQAAIKPLKPAYCDLTDYWLCFSLPSWLVGVGVKFGGQCGRVPCTHAKSYCCSLSVFNPQKEKKVLLLFPLWDKKMTDSLGPALHLIRQPILSTFSGHPSSSTSLKHILSIHIHEASDMLSLQRSQWTHWQQIYHQDGFKST